MEGRTGASLSDMPEEVVLMLLQCLPVEDLWSVSVVSRRLHSLSGDEALWKPLCHPSWYSSQKKSSYRELYMNWLRKAYRVYSTQNPESTRSGADERLQVLLVGDTGTGKTCLHLRFFSDTFTHNYLPTLGVEFQSRFCQVPILTRKELFRVSNCFRDDRKINRVFVGQDRFFELTKSYFKHAAGIILVYDVTDKNSFDHVESLWLDRIAHYAPTKAQRVLIIGNKTDLPNRVIDTDVGKELAARVGASFIETSALLGENVKEAFHRLVQAMVRIEWGEGAGPRPPYVPDQERLRQRGFLLAVPESKPKEQSSTWASFLGCTQQ